MRLVVAVDPPSPDAPLLYEAEWNEQATPAEHRDAVRYFARQAGLTVNADSLDIGADDAVWIQDQQGREDAATLAWLRERETDEEDREHAYPT